MDVTEAMSSHFNGPGVGDPAGVDEHGIGATGFSRNLGGPARLRAKHSGSGDRITNPWPLVSVLDQWERSARRNAR